MDKNFIARELLRVAKDLTSGQIDEDMAEMVLTKATNMVNKSWGILSKAEGLLNSLGRDGSGVLTDKSSRELTRLKTKTQDALKSMGEIAHKLDYIEFKEVKEARELIGGGFGKLGGDEADVFEALVMMNSDKSDSVILALVKKDDWLMDAVNEMDISDNELRRYIREQKRFVKMMNRMGLSRGVTASGTSYSQALREAEKQAEMDDIAKALVDMAKSLVASDGSEIIDELMSLAKGRVIKKNLKGKRPWFVVKYKGDWGIGYRIDLEKRGHIGFWIFEAHPDIGGYIGRSRRVVLNVGMDRKDPEEIARELWKYLPRKIGELKKMIDMQIEGECIETSHGYGGAPPACKGEFRGKSSENKVEASDGMSFSRALREAKKQAKRFKKMMYVVKDDGFHVADDFDLDTFWAGMEPEVAVHPEGEVER